MTVKNKLLTMLRMQDTMNRAINEDWIARNEPWYRAIWIECGEFIEHHGYKWWKKQELNLEQMKMELVDIWHFGLSDLFREGRGAVEIAYQLEPHFQYPHSSHLKALDLAELLAYETLAAKRFALVRFLQLMHATGMSFDELYQTYVAKNVLNVFRQEHGYKAGTYVKIWDGREDNEHLTELLAELDPNADDFADTLYGRLQERYDAVTTAA